MEEGILIYETHGMYTETQKRNTCISRRLSFATENPTQVDIATDW